MVPLIAVLGIGSVAYVAYSSLKKHMAALEAEERRKKQDLETGGELEVDPKTGRYRPRS